MHSLHFVIPSGDKMLQCCHCGNVAILTLLAAALALNRKGRVSSIDSRHSNAIKLVRN
jgi:hypothetical protein